MQNAPKAQELSLAVHAAVPSPASPEKAWSKNRRLGFGLKGSSVEVPSCFHRSGTTVGHSACGGVYGV